MGGEGVQTDEGGSGRHRVCMYLRTRPPAHHACLFFFAFVSRVQVALVPLTFGHGPGEHFRRDELVHDVVLEHASDLPVRCGEDMPVEVLFFVLLEKLISSERSYS